MKLLKFIIALIMAVVCLIILILAGAWLFIIYKPLLWLSKKVLGNNPSKKRASTWISICFVFKAVYDGLLYAANWGFNYIAHIPGNQKKKKIEIR